MATKLKFGRVWGRRLVHTSRVAVPDTPPPPVVEAEPLPPGGLAPVGPITRHYILWGTIPVWTAELLVQRLALVRGAGLGALPVEALASPLFSVHTRAQFAPARVMVTRSVLLITVGHLLAETITTSEFSDWHRRLIQAYDEVLGIR